MGALMDPAFPHVGMILFGLAVFGTVGLAFWAFDWIDKNTKLFARFTPEDKGIIAVVAILVTLFIGTMAAQEIVVAPCRATESWHTVTNDFGAYETAYVDNSRWCLWVRGNFD